MQNSLGFPGTGAHTELKALLRISTEDLLKGKLREWHEARESRTHTGKGRKEKKESY